MDIFQILKEAKSPGSTKKEDNIIIKQSDTTDDDTSTYEDDIDDANEDADSSNYEDDIDDDNELESEKYEETIEPSDDDSESEKDEDTTSDEDTGSEVDTDSTSYEDGIDSGESDNSTSDEGTGEDVNTEDTPEEIRIEKLKNRSLYQDFTNFYYTIKTTLTKLGNFYIPSPIANSIIFQVKKNLNKMENTMFDFMVNVYPNNTYLKNFRIYRYFVEAYKLNTEILKKIKSFNGNS